MMKDFLANRTQRVYGTLPRISSRTVMVLKICQWFTRKSIVKPKDADDKSPFLIVNAVHCSTNELQLRLITQIILKKSYSRAKRRSKTTHYYILIICCWTMVCVKSVRIQSFSGSYFFRIQPEYGEYAEYSVSLRIQSECGKMRTRKTPNTDNFYTVY